MAIWFFIIVPVVALAIWYYRLYRLQIGDSKVVSIERDDETIQLLKEKAQNEWPTFFRLADKHGLTEDRCKFYVKCTIEENELREHIWILVSSFNGTHFRGTLANDPSRLTAVKFGDSLFVHQEEVEDWQVLDYLTSKRHGAFTRKYVRSKSDLLGIAVADHFY